MQNHQFRVGNRVAIVAGAWQGSTGNIVSIMPDRGGMRDDSIQVHLESTSADAIARPQELERISN
jgi:transcription antitermination factor NusG